MIAHVSVAVVIVGAVVSGTASASTGWRHVSVDRRVGTVQATLSYDARPGHALGGMADTGFRRISLVVRRAGKITTEYRMRSRVLLQGSLGLTLRNVWGSAEPEALVETASCGNRCGVQLHVALGRDGGGRVLFHDFGGLWPGPRAAWDGQSRGGRFYFISSDRRFFCTFTSCAGSSVPPQVFAIDATGRGFVDVTRSRPDVVAASAKNLWHTYLSDRMKTSNGYAVLGTIAPWCADQYLLGRRALCDRALTRELRRGYLGDRSGATPPAGRAFITYLHKELAAWGYGEK